MTPSNVTKSMSPGITQTFNSSRELRVTAMPAAVATTINVSGTARDRRNADEDMQHFYDDKKLAHDIGLAVVILVAMLIPIAVLEFLIEPYQRGFFCDDESIRYPFQTNTVSFLMLLLCLMVFPIPLIIGIETVAYYRQSGGSREYIHCFGWNMPSWLYSSLRHFFYYVFGNTAVLELTEIGKFTIGRLRPHFMAVCQPQFFQGSSCDDAQNHNRYIVDYICIANGFDQADVRQARLSFPSGHASLIVYAMVYLSLFMEVKLRSIGPKLLRHFIQLTLLLFAWFTSLSRVMDNWHHWSDVLVGMILGLIGAIITAKYVSKLFHPSNSISSFRLNSIPRHDTTATLQDVL